MQTIQVIRYKNARRLMRDNGGTSAFSALIGRDPSYVSHIVGDNPLKGIGHKMARHIEHCTGKPEGWLDTDHGEATFVRQKNHGEGTTSDGDFATLRIARIKQSEEGSPIVATEGSMGGVPKTVLDRLGITDEQALLVEVHGDAHGLALPDGSLVAVNTQDTQPREGKFYALRDDDMLRVRILVPQPGGGLILRTHNRADYPDETLTPDQAGERIEILGRVFWSATTWQ